MLSQELITQLLMTAKARVPFEMCGLLFSQHRFIETANSASLPTREFLIRHEEYLSVCMIQDDKPWAIVHSHPGKGAAPSVKDCQLMDALDLAKQDIAMVIVGLTPEEIRIFKKRGDLYHLEWRWPIPSAGST